MKIVFLRSNPVNPDSRVEKETYSLVKAGYEVSILCWDRESNHRERKENLCINGVNIPVFRLGFKAGFGQGVKSIFPFSLFQFSMGVWLVKNRKTYDTIHACDFDTAFLSCKIARILNKKFIFDIFDFLYGDPKSIFQKIIKKMQLRIIDRASGTIICSEDRKKQIYGSRPKELAIIHNTPNRDFFKNLENKFEFNSKKVKVVYVGILQDYRLLIEISDFFKKNGDIELHIGGFGKYEDYFEKLSEEYENIKFYGKLTYNDTIALEKSCDIMLAIYDPSIENHIFAAPNKFYEALMLGKPVIMVRGTGMSNIIEKNKIGYLIEYSENGFSEGIYNLIKLKGQWESMGMQMRKLYNTDYSWDSMNLRLLQFYKTIEER